MWHRDFSGCICAGFYLDSSRPKLHFTNWIVAKAKSFICESLRWLLRSLRSYNFVQFVHNFCTHEPPQVKVLCPPSHFVRLREFSAVNKYFISLERFFISFLDGGGWTPALETRRPAIAKTSGRVCFNLCFKSIFRVTGDSVLEALTLKNKWPPAPAAWARLSLYKY